MTSSNRQLRSFLLVGLAVLVLGLTLQAQSQAAYFWQSPLPGVDPPPDDEPDVPEDDMVRIEDVDVCATKTKHCVTFDYLGYETATDGTTTLQFRITNHCNQQVKWVEIVSRQWERIDPAQNSSYAGDLGNYIAKWINDAPTHPYRVGYRFKPEFDTFKQEASDTFSIRVQNFNPNRRMRLRAKVGNEIERAGLRPIRFACGTTPGPTPTPPNPQDVCLSKTEGQITFDFYGYVHNGDGSTTLTFGVTNPKQRALDAIGFKARGWSRLSPVDQSVYTGSLGTYRARWMTHNNTPNQEAFRFKTQGNWFRQGASDQFAIAVHNFDPTKRITAWVKLNNQWFEVKGRLSDHDCDQTPPPPPTPTHTPTATPSPTATSPNSPLPTPTATAIPPTPTVVPTVVAPQEFAHEDVLLFNQEMFDIELTEAEKQARWDAGLPVPEVIIIPVESALESYRSGHFKPGLMAMIPQQAVSGWGNLYDENFESGDLSYTQKDDCQLFNVRTTSNAPEWGIDDFWIAKSRSNALWPAAAGNGALDPSLGMTYPTNFVTQMFCTFDNAQSFENFMVEFDMWQDQSATMGDRDTFYVGFHTGEEDDQGVDLYYTLGWRQTQFDASADVNDHIWETKRIFYPDIAADAAANGSTQIKVVWRFFSDQLTDDSDRGVWLDNIKVEKYTKPAASIGCADRLTSSNDTQIQVPGAPGTGMASKGLNVPPYAETIRSNDTGGVTNMINHMDSADVQWVRLEFAIHPSAFDAVTGAGQIDNFDAQLDLKHYDLLVDAYCQNNIAVMGLIDYQSLARQDWANNGGFVDGTGYLEAFRDRAGFIVDYFDDRIDHWEIWNEPDFSESFLVEDEFRKLMNATYTEIKQRQSDDMVVLGGVSHIDPGGRNYFNVVYQAILDNTAVSSFDVVGFHPYYHYDDTGRLMLNPDEYLRYGTSDTNTTLGILQLRIEDDFFGRDTDEGKEFWATELGWNAAEGQLANPDLNLQENCPFIIPELVSKLDQAVYLHNSFNILFKETAWRDGTPGVTKIFWYQYQDTGQNLPLENCRPQASATLLSASYMASYLHAAQVGQVEEKVVVPWEFGLYDGNFSTKPSHCVFAEYPSLGNCLSPDGFENFVYLPLIEADGISASN